LAQPVSHGHEPAVVCWQLRAVAWRVAPSHQTSWPAWTMHTTWPLLQRVIRAREGGERPVSVPFLSTAMMYFVSLSSAVNLGGGSEGAKDSRVTREPAVLGVQSQNKLRYDRLVPNKMQNSVPRIFRQGLWTGIPAMISTAEARTKLESAARSARHFPLPIRELSKQTWLGSVCGAGNHLRNCAAIS
jgi:hypothetical protein